MSTILLFVSFILPSFASLPSETKARFVYLELRPNSEKGIIIQTPKCGAKDDLQVKTFNSEAKVTNGTVNTLHVYARSGDCTSPLSSVWSRTVRAPKNKKYTHVYITLQSESVMVLQEP